MSAAPLGAAQNYPLLNLFWTMLWLFIWILWIFLLVRIILDIFRSDDLGGWSKALWVIFIIILPFIGVLVYLIARGSGMQKRDVRDARAADQEMRGYIREAAATPGAPSTAEELTKLATLRDQGVLTEAEFDAQKAKLLA
jgi:ABC-type multidrug transport system fused ATPase/permease subunit